MTKNDDRVTEWEEGLPTPEELTPLSQTLISPELASAFSIPSESVRTAADVQRASQSAFTTLLRSSSKELGHHHNNRAPTAFVQDAEDARDDDASVYPHPFQAHAGISSSPGKYVLNGSPYAAAAAGSSPAYDRRPDVGSSPIAFASGADNNNSEARKPPKPNDRDAEEAESGTQPENSNDDQSARTLKRPRLVWTPQLHKRFVDAVAHLGIKHAVPKTIMQLMNVEGLTRENVASHLQKYRLYLKRLQGFPNEGPSTSDQLFASTPVPPSLAASTHFLAGHREDVIAFPFPAPGVPLPIAGISHTPMPSHINPVGPFPGFDPRAYSALARTLPPLVTPADQRNIAADNQHQSDSPPRPILTLFPSTD